MIAERPGAVPGDLPHPGETLDPCRVEGVAPGDPYKGRTPGGLLWGRAPCRVMVAVLEEMETLGLAWGRAPCRVVVAVLEDV